MLFAVKAEDLPWVVKIIQNALRGLYSNLCQLIYPLISTFYQVFSDMGKMFYNDSFSKIYTKISTIIGVFMIFRVIFWLIELLVNPDLISDKEKNPGKIIQKVLISVVLLATTPRIFKLAFNLQYDIINEHVIESIISLDNSTLLYREIAERFITAGSDGITLSSDKLPIGWYSGWNVSDSHDPAVIAGVIIDKKSNYFTLGQIKNKSTNLDTRADYIKSNDINNVGGVADYAITDETKVSVIDLTESRSNKQFYAGTTADIIPTTVPDAYISINSDGTECIYWTKKYDGMNLYELVEMNFAVAKVVDGYATDIFVIKGYIA